MSNETPTSNPAGTSPQSNNTTPQNSGRGSGGRGRNGGRGRGARNRNQNGNSNGLTTRKQGTQVFKGNTDGINCHVFQCYGETTDRQQFTKTLGVLGEYINKTLTHPQDVASVCKNFKLTPPE